jgi:hypothetical protein
MLGDPRRRLWVAPGLAALVYLVVAVAIWSGVWFGHPTTTATCGCGDTALFTWFMAWGAHVIAHGGNVFFTTRLHHPYGINLPANTSVLAISLPLAPVSWAFGPVASLNVAATLAPVGGALAARALVRRWTTWEPAAFMAGLFYGFSPFVVESLALEHVDTATLVVPPLIVLCLDELVVRQRGRAWAWGLVLGGLLTLQFFISSEVLVMCVLAAGFGVAIVIAGTAVGDRGALRSKAHHALMGIGTAAVSAGALLSYPARYATAGPRPLPRHVWPDVAYFGSPWRTLLLPAGLHDRGPNAILESYGYFGSHPLLLGYLGIGMVGVLAVGLVRFRRERLLWFCAAMLVILDALSLGASAWPWRIFQSVPIVENVVPDRFAAVGDLFAAAMLGIIVDRAHRSTRWWDRRSGAPPLDASSGDDGPRRWWRPRTATLVAVGLAGVALLPIAWQYDLPFVTRPVDVPPWFTTVGSRLPTTAVVLTYPFPSSGLQAPMTWQAVATLRFSMVGGGGITPAPPSRPTPAQRVDASAAADLSALSYGYFPLPTGTPAELQRLRQAVHDWGVTTVVVPSEDMTPPSIRPRSVPLAIATITAALGGPPTRQHGSWVWSVHRVPGSPLRVPPGVVTACAESATAARHPGAAAACVMAAVPRLGPGTTASR